MPKLLLAVALAAAALGGARFVGRARAQDSAETSAPADGAKPAPDAKPAAAAAEGKEKEKDKEEAPEATVPVTIGFYVSDIHDVDVKACTFGAEFYYWMRHAKQKDDAAAKEIETVEFTNGKLDNPPDEQDRKDVGGETYVCWKAQGSFRFQPQLRNYPFDKQRLEIQVEHPKLEIDRVVYEDDRASYERSGEPQQRWGVKGSVDIPEYEIRSVERRSLASRYKTDFGDPESKKEESVYSRFVISITIVRLFGPYFFKIVLPLLVILGMAYLVFWLPPKEIQSATGLAITALLSCIAFDVTVAQNLPSVGYLVVSDKFFMATYFLLFANLCQSVITYHLFEHGKGEFADKWDEVCRWLFPVFYAIAFAYLLIMALLINA
jgi:hypothetical protein